jgi:inhibitor of cysteine peptidase
MPKYFLFLTVLLGLVSAKYYNVDEVTEVELEVDGQVSLSLKANPSTGYSWFLNPPNSPYIEVLGMLTGDYEAGTAGMLGAPGRQVFRVGCTSLCVAGTYAEVLLTYQRPWEKSPIDSRKIKLNIVNPQSTRDLA